MSKEEREQQSNEALTAWLRKQENGEEAWVGNVWSAAVVWADQHPHWISVDEELPPASCGVISDPVLVFIGNNKGWCGYIREGVYDHAAKEWSYMNRGRTHKVTHWMPIVPPRKEE